MNAIPYLPRGAGMEQGGAYLDFIIKRIKASEIYIKCT